MRDKKPLWRVICARTSTSKDSRIQKKVFMLNEQVLVAKVNKAAIGKQFKKEGKPLQEALEALTQEDAACIKKRWLP